MKNSFMKTYWAEVKQTLPFLVRHKMMTTKNVDEWFMSLLNCLKMKQKTLHFSLHILDLDNRDKCFNTYTWLCVIWSICIYTRMQEKTVPHFILWMTSFTTLFKSMECSDQIQPFISFLEKKPNNSNIWHSYSTIISIFGNLFNRKPSIDKAISLIPTLPCQ